MRRWAAAALDAALALLLAVLVSDTVGRFFAARAAAVLRIGEPGTFWRGPLPLVLGLLGNIVYVLPATVLLVQAGELVGMTTPGKALLGLAVRQDSPAVRWWRRWFLKVGGPLLMTAGLLTGFLPLLVAGTVLAAFAVAGFLLVFTGGGRRALHDRLAGTAVTRAAGSAVTGSTSA